MTTTAKHLLSEIVAGLDGADKSPLASKGITVSEENIRSIAAYVEQLEKALGEARAEADMLQEILDGRPAINAGLPATYIRWSQSIYSGDAIRAALGGSNE